MSYIVNWASTGDPGGKSSITIADKTSDLSSTSVTLTGKGLNNYGLFQQENFIRLLENFARTQPPSNPTTGQNWYHSTERIMYLYTGAGPFYNGWDQSSPTPIPVGGLADYMPMATLLNSIVGSPVYSGSDTTEAYGWGQTDLVPTYNANGTLDAASLSAEGALPPGQTFPPVFTNSSWAILISRLRKAMRQVGHDEALTSPVGFIFDGRPLAPGNTLANYYNNINTGPLPYQGTIANITDGWNGVGITAVTTYMIATKLALNNLDTVRFELAPTSTQINSLATAARTTPGQSLGVPSAVGTYVHQVQLTFLSKAKAQAFFNAGGKLQFNWSFTPSNIGSETDVELDWKNFLLAFTGLTFDYFGTELDDFYEPYIPGEYTRGYYHVIDSGSDLKVFERSVLDTPGGGLYSSDPPTDGGIIVTMSAVTGVNYVVTIKIEYYLQNITGEPVDVTLDGTLSSNITAYSVNSLNTNLPSIPLPAVAQSGTFITAP